MELLTASLSTSITSRKAGLFRSQDRPCYGTFLSPRPIPSANSVVQVGLPARGKSYLSNKLMRYLKVVVHIPCFGSFSELVPSG